MSNWKSAQWKKGKRIIKGKWKYNRCSDTFTIVLDSKDPITGRQRIVKTHNDIPEWDDNWKLLRE